MSDGKQSKGGKARAESLTPEQRSAIARNAALARTAAPQPPTDLAATHRGKLTISADLEFPCAVLTDGTRVITEAAITEKLGRRLGGKSKRLAVAMAGDGVPMPAYIAPALQEYVPTSLRVALNNPIIYRDRGGLRRAVPATLIPEICEVWLAARDAGALQDSQQPIAKNAEILMRALTRVAITALVDEATGYQEVRDRDELHRILAYYVNDEWLPWTKRFPDEYYKQLFRLQNWQYSPPSVKRPRQAGKLTAKLVYEKLPKGVLEELRSKNPADEKGYRKRKLHQYLTTDIGHPHLQSHVASVTTLMKASPNWTAFKKLFARAFPDPDALEVHKLPGFEDDEADDF